MTVWTKTTFPSNSGDNTLTQTTFPSLWLIKGKQTVGAGVLRNQPIMEKITPSKDNNKHPSYSIPQRWKGQSLRKRSVLLSISSYFFLQAETWGMRQFHNGLKYCKGLFTEVKRSTMGALVLHKYRSTCWSSLSLGLRRLKRSLCCKRDADRMCQEFLEWHAIIWNRPWHRVKQQCSWREVLHPTLLCS